MHEEISNIGIFIFMVFIGVPFLILVGIQVKNKIRSTNGFCCFVKNNTHEPSWDFCERLLKKKPIGLALVPGITYNDYCEYYVRVGFGVAKPDTFRAALEIIEEEAREYKG